MTKEEIINSIEGLYPVDSIYADTRETGKTLLVQAICDDWRDLSIEILQKYYTLCLEENRRYLSNRDEV
jgi:hypothetical protein